MADRYAAALYELAQDQKSLDSVEADLKDLGAMIADSPDLRRVLASPVLSREGQQKALDVLAAKAAFGPLTTKFLGMLSLHRRAQALGAIIEAFQGRLRAARGEVTAHVATASALTSGQEAALVSALKKELGNDNLSVVAKVDPALLGGMVVQVGSRMIDSSLRTKLKSLHFAMKGVG